MSDRLIEDLEETIAVLISVERRRSNAEISLLKEQLSASQKRIDDLESSIVLDVIDHVNAIPYLGKRIDDLYKRGSDVNHRLECHSSDVRKLTKDFSDYRHDESLRRDQEKETLSEQINEVNESLRKVDFSENIERIMMDFESLKTRIEDSENKFSDDIEKTNFFLMERMDIADEAHSMMSRRLDEFVVAKKFTEFLGDTACRLQDVESRLNIHDERIEQVKEAGIESARATIEEHKNLIDGLQKQFDAIDLDQMISSYEENIRDLEKQVDVIRTLVADSERDYEEKGNRLEQRIDEHKKTLIEAIDSKIEIARLDANLWKETTKNQVYDIQARIDDSDDLFNQLGDALGEAIKQNKELISQYEKAVSQRLEHVGPYKAGTIYKRNQCVCRDYATFICVADETDIDPREKTDTPHWRLMAARGEKGSDGVGARGPRGEKGEPGKKGADGISFVAAEIGGSAIALASSDGSVHRIDIGPAISKAVTEYVDAKMAESVK